MRHRDRDGADVLHCTGIGLEGVPHGFDKANWGEFDETHYDIYANTATTASFTVSAFGLMFFILARPFRFICEGHESRLARMQDQIDGLTLTAHELKHIAATKEAKKKIKRKSRLRKCGSTVLNLLVNVRWART